MRLLQGPLAQLVEQLAFNQLVAGSNPARPTIFLFSIKCLVRYRVQRPVPQHHQLSFIHPVCRLNELLQLRRGLVGGDIAVLVA